MNLWHIEGNQVKRGRQVIALIGNIDDGKLSWAGLDMERIGFDDLDELLDDVKYFHRFNTPALVLTFKSGRKLVYRR